MSDQTDFMRKAAETVMSQPIDTDENEFFVFTFDKNFVSVTPKTTIREPVLTAGLIKMVSAGIPHDGYGFVLMGKLARLHRSDLSDGDTGRDVVKKAGRHVQDVYVVAMRYGAFTKIFVQPYVKYGGEFVREGHVFTMDEWLDKYYAKDKDNADVFTDPLISLLDYPLSEALAKASLPIPEEFIQRTPIA